VSIDANKNALDVSAILARLVAPPLIVFTPSPLVVPREIFDEFLSRVQSLGWRHTAEKAPRLPPPLPYSDGDDRLAELQMIVQELLEKRRAQSASPASSSMRR